jgi:RecB family exonuclease
MENALLRPDVSDGLRPFILAAVLLLERLKIHEWLTPAVSAPRATNDPLYEAVPLVEYEKDQQAYFKLLSVLEGLAASPPDRLPCDGGARPDVQAALEIALAAESYQIKTEDDAGVQIFELREIRGLRFRQVYVLGLVHGQLPALAEEGALASRRRAIGPLEQQLEAKEAEIEHLFSQAVQAAGEQLVLCRPVYDDEQKTLASPFLTAIEERTDLLNLAVDGPLVTVRQADQTLGRALRGRELADNQIAELCTRFDSSGGDRFTRTAASVVDWRDRGDQRLNVIVGQDDHLRAILEHDRAFSASELETYAACPFLYFGTHILKLEERETDETRLDYGSLVHRTLHRFYAQRRVRLSADDERPLPAVGKDERSQLVDAFLAELEHFDAGLIPPDLVHLFECPGGVADLFLDAIGHVEGDGGFGNLLSEYTLSDVMLGNDDRGRPVALSGKIDRVDARRPQGQEAIIIDYKTGKPPGATELMTKLADGRLLQLPLYAAGLQAEQTQLRVVGGAYVHLPEKESVPGESPKKSIAEVGPCLGLRKKGLAEAFDAEAARRQAIELASAIRAGRFPLTRFPVGEKHPQCRSHCPLRHACRHPKGYEPRPDG